MDLQLDNVSTVVAGSSRGIGRAIATAFLSEGARVLISGRDSKALRETEIELRERFGSDNLLAFQGDLLSESDIQRALDTVLGAWGSPGVVVANIGSGKGDASLQPDEEEWHRSFNTNFDGARRLVGAVVPEMIKGGGGSVILIASIVGAESVDAPLPYSAAKAALINYGKNLARRLGEQSIRVNTVAPGNILFPGGRWEEKMAEDPKRFGEFIETQVPLRRFGTAEEIADLVVFLASPRAAYLTGACIVADGGQTRGIFV